MDAFILPAEDVPLVLLTSSTELPFFLSDMCSLELDLARREIMRPKRPAFLVGVLGALLIPAAREVLIGGGGEPGGPIR